jgi:hypothetical protein
VGMLPHLICHLIELQLEVKAHLELHDVGVLPALALREELRHDGRPVQLLVQIQELDGHLLPRVLVQRQLHEADVSPAR